MLIIKDISNYKRDTLTLRRGTKLKEALSAEALAASMETPSFSDNNPKQPHLEQKSAKLVAAQFWPFWKDSIQKNK